MQSVKMYTGDDGQSHFEDLDLPFDPAQEVHRTDVQAALGWLNRLTFTPLVNKGSQQELFVRGMALWCTQGITFRMA